METESPHQATRPELFPGHKNEYPVQQKTQSPTMEQSSNERNTRSKAATNISQNQRDSRDITPTFPPPSARMETLSIRHENFISPSRRHPPPFPPSSRLQELRNPLPMLNQHRQTKQPQPLRSSQHHRNGRSSITLHHRLRV